MQPNMRLMVIIAAFSVAAIGCAPTKFERPALGDPQAGRSAMERHQCGACHTIPGVAGARGLVGPPLTDYGRRVYIAGQLPQHATLLARWIQDAPAIDPGTSMPKLSVSDDEARNMVAYLYRLH